MLGASVSVKDRKEMKKIKSAVLVLLSMVAGFAGAAAFASPAQAASPCYWISTGNTSNCDGWSRSTASANGCNDFKYIDGVRLGDSGAHGPGNDAFLSLLYSPSCRSVIGDMEVNNLPAGSNCYFKIVRNSDGEAYYTGHPAGTSHLNSPLLYDAGVTSYAWAYCKYGSNGPVFTGGTRSY